MKIADPNSADSNISAIGQTAHKQNMPQRPSVEKHTVKKSAQPTAEEVTAPSVDRIMLNKMEGANDQTLEVAKKIRAVDKTMTQIEEKVQSMRAFLDGVVKAYPPYPPGSDERVHALRQFAALRKQIDQLMVPAPQESDPTPLVGVKATHDTDWLQSGAGLNLPELSDESADTELAEAVKSLDNAYEKFQQTHREFIEDANHIIASLK